MGAQRRSGPSSWSDSHHVHGEATIAPVCPACARHSHPCLDEAPAPVCRYERSRPCRHCCGWSSWGLHGTVARARVDVALARRRAGGCTEETVHPRRPLIAGLRLVRVGGRHCSQRLFAKGCLVSPPPLKHLRNILDGAVQLGALRIADILGLGSGVGIQEAVAVDQDPEGRACDLECVCVCGGTGGFRGWPSG